MQKIPFDTIKLQNGLNVILHQNHSTPITAVNVWYHVGSKNESPGKTGFAHLFEHIMFEGSKHHNRSHFDSLQVVGATLNGSTTTDRTNYWENLPSNHLELAIWLESDRMGFLLEALESSPQIHCKTVCHLVVQNQLLLIFHAECELAYTKLWQHQSVHPFPSLPSRW